MSGSYGSCYLVAKWSGESGECQLPVCGRFPGNIFHLLSYECADLCPHLLLNFSRNLNKPGSYPDLERIVSDVFLDNPEAWLQLIVTPSTNRSLISLQQTSGREKLYILLNILRSFIFCLHKVKINFLKQLNII